MTDEKLRELLQDMSLEEKIGQMLQLTGNFYNDEGLATGPMEEMEISQDQVNNAGSVLSCVGASKLRKMQDDYMKKQPHHIPMVFMADVINGYRCVFPIPLAQGCSFHPELSEKMSEIAAKESARAGLHAVFSPMVDLVRDARWGRVMESTGEDVYLNSLFARAMVQGYQGKGIGEKDRVSACIKHFAGYGSPVGGREYNQVEVSERSLYEEYLPSYKAGIDAGSRMVMTSFNTLGRIPCTGNQKLMRGLLREQWGFDGILISDWAAIQELLYHSIAEKKEDAALLAMEAGVDIDMVTNVYCNHLEKLVDEGKLPVSLIDEAVLRILRFKNELGLFEAPYKDADETYDQTDKPDFQHLAFARKALPETFVLLKNDGILPLEKNGKTKKKYKTAFIGPFVESNEVCGCWSLFYHPEENVTIQQALMERNDLGEIGISKGCTILAPGEHLLGFTRPVDNKVTAEEMEDWKQEAVRMAMEAENVVLAIGEHPQMSGEGASRTEITVPEHQLELFRAVYQANPNVAVVNFSGRPLDLREINDKARAVLQVWFPGTETGHAVVDVLYGDASPSGRLSMSFPYNVGQVPVYYNELHTGRICQDAVNRFCSRYIDAPNQPLFVFGYGLDYTTYDYQNLRLSGKIIADDEPLTVYVDVTNTGERDGVEVVQLYVQDLCGSVARPVRELKGFKKLQLKAGETKTVEFTITLDMLKFYDINMDYVAEPGTFRVFAGHDSRAALSEEFVYEKEV